MPAVDPAAILYAALLANADGDDDTARDLGELIGDPEQAEVLADGEVVAKAFRKASVHAPAGGVTVGGKEYKGGEFIPGDVMDKATDEEKAAVEGGRKAEKKVGAKSDDIPGRVRFSLDAMKDKMADLDHESLSRSVQAVSESGYAMPGFDIGLMDMKQFQQHAGKDWKKTPATVVYKNGQRELQVNPFYFRVNDRKQRAESGHASGHYSTPSEDHVFLHELGHLLHGTAETTATDAERFDTTEDAQTAKTVSGRAAVSPVEFVAEVFAGTVHGNKYPPAVEDLYRRLGGPQPSVKPPAN
jgi:hypothetical protein